MIEASVTMASERPASSGERKTTAVARIVQTPGSALPYKVVFTDQSSVTSEHAFATIREAEAFIRQNTPAPTARSELYDREAGEA